MNKAKRGKISNYQLFCILIVSRVVVTLSYFKSISLGEFSSDTLVSFALGYALSLLFALPVYGCVVKGKNPLSVRWLAVLYMLAYVYLASVSVNRFAYFSSGRIQPESSVLFIIVLISAAAGYSAVLGIEGLGRFSVLCSVMLLAVVLIAVLSNVKNIHVVNYYPFFKNTKSVVLQNSLVFATNSAEPVVFLLLGQQKVNGVRAKSLFGAVTVSSLTILLLICVCIGVMGAAAPLYAFPGYALYQMASVGTFSRMDVIHTAFWVFSLFLKTALFIYCASVSLRAFSHTAKCTCIAVAVCGISAVLNELTLKSDLASKGMAVSVILYGIFAVAIPIICLLTGKSEKELSK